MDFYKKFELAKTLSFSNKEECEAIPSELWSDEEFASLAAINSAESLDYMPKFKNDLDFCLRLVGVSSIEDHVGSELLNNKRFVMHLLHNNTYNFKVISDELKNDLDVVVKVFKSKRWRDDADMAKNIGTSLLSDPEHAKLIVSMTGAAYPFVSDEFKKDKSLLMLALSHRSKNLHLKDIHEDFRSDRDVLDQLCAFDEDDWNLLPVELQQSRDFWLRFIFRSRTAPKFLFPHFIQDRTFQLLFVASLSSYSIKEFKEQFPELLPECEYFSLFQKKYSSDSIYDYSVFPKECWSDIDVVQAMLLFNCNRDLIELTSTILENNRELALRSLQEARFVPECYRNDKEFAVEMMKRDWRQPISHFSEEIRNDIPFMKSLLQQGYNVLSHSPKELQEDSELVEKLVLRDPEVIEKLTKEQQKEFWKQVVFGDIVIDAFVMSRVTKQEYLEEVEYDDLHELLIKYPKLYTNLSLEKRLDVTLLKKGLRGLRGWDLDKAMPKEFRSRDDIMRLLLCEKSEDFIEYMDDRFKADKDIMKACVMESAYSFKYASESLKTDIPYLREIKEIDINILQHVSEEIKTLLSASEIRTSTLRGKYLVGTIIPNKSPSSSELPEMLNVSLTDGTNTLYTADKMNMCHYEWHSYYSCSVPSESNSLVLVGDFLFYTSHLDLSFASKKGSGQRYGHQIYLVDYHSESSSELLDTQAQEHPSNLHLVAEGVELPIGAGFAHKKASTIFSAVTDAAAGDKIHYQAEELVEFQEGVCFVKPVPNMSSCGGAALIALEEHGKRWFIPQKDGSYTWEQLQHDLANHTYEDEWALLKERYLSEATEEEKKLVQEYFLSLGSDELKAEVNDYFQL